MEETKKPRAIGYVRVSTKGQADNGVSIDMQREKIRAYCEFYELELVDILEDAGKSGKNMKRPAAQELIKLVEDKAFDALIIYKLDRLGRSVIDLLSFSQLLEKNDVSLHSINEKLDTTSSFGRFFFTVISALAQLERDIISERTREAMDHKRQRGELLGSAPIGKMVVGNLLVDDPETIRIIDLVKDWREEGNSLRQIGNLLAGEGFLSRTGKPYSAETINCILKRNTN